MVAKQCPRCGRVSYSAAERGEWLCPYCGHDLTQEPAKPAGHHTCPDCGSGYTHLLLWRPPWGGESWMVRCMQCGRRGPEKPTRSEAVRTWRNGEEDPRWASNSRDTTLGRLRQAQPPEADRARRRLKYLPAIRGGQNEKLD